MTTTNQKLKSDVKEGAGSWIAGHKYGEDTLIVHAGVKPDPVTGAILTPIYQSTTFVQESIEKYAAKGFSYSRSANPTVRDLEERIAALEMGAGACCFATGMAATCTIISTFMKTGDHCVITNCSYGGTNRACREFFAERFGCEFSFIDMTDHKVIEAAVKPNTKLIISETPANPTLTLIDIAKVSELCKAKGIIHACDSTFATPIVLRPLEHGVDVVLQSTTKYYDGHDMTVGGAVICATDDHVKKIRYTQNILGNNMTAHVAFLQLQTVKTIKLRVLQQSKTALKIAEFLEKHPKVESVRYPGLKSHPQHALATQYHRNGVHGGMLWFEVKGGSVAGQKLMDSIRRPWALCENLGAVESIITCCAVMTHSNMLKEDREKVGISDGLVRVSAGLEDADDLIMTLKEALDKL